ncbi:hypothetical protein C2E23DRAFT_882158 [Lenzites betulinus]|nr:hypothetical protein C2E23DRAFT_882158 [Lenzites betulinus]
MYHGGSGVPSRNQEFMLEHHYTRSDPGPTEGSSLFDENDEWSETLLDTSTERPVLPDIPRELDIENLYRGRKDIYTSEQKAKAWTDAADMVKKYSDEMVERWNRQIDTYLVFAGLFSGILTAFNVESYKLLRPPLPDENVDTLQRISPHNRNQPSIFLRTDSDEASLIPLWVIWLNALWFSGLILGLSSAAIGIMVKQWLDEYKSALSGTSRPVARVRQYRLNNLREWRVEAIVGIIPVLLQVALACFLAGLLVLVWNLHQNVAIIATILVGLLSTFTIATTVLPLFDNTCAYLSPQVRALDYLWRPRCFCYQISLHSKRAYQRMRTLPSTLRSGMVSWICPGSACSSTHASFSSIAPPVVQSSRRRSQLRRIIGQITLSFETALSTWRKFVEAGKGPKSTWQGRERSKIADCRKLLDTQILVEAYHSTLDPDALSAATVCLKDFADGDVREYFKRLHDSAREHFGADADARTGPLGWGNKHQLLWLHIFLCALLHDCENRDCAPLSDTEWAALRVYFLTGSWSFGAHAADAEWALSTLTSMIQNDAAEKQLDRKSFLQVRSKLLHICSRRGIRLRKALTHAVIAAYRYVRLSADQLPEILSDASPGAYTKHIRSVDWFLECADQALTPPHYADDIAAVRAYTQDVLTAFTRTLLMLFDSAHRHDLPATIDARSLEDVLERLRRHVSDEVIRCIPSALVPDVLEMTDRLNGAADYADMNTVWRIQYFAREFRATVVRVKGAQETEMKDGTSPSEPPITPADPSPDAPSGIVITTTNGSLGSPQVAPINDTQGKSQLLSTQISRSPSPP